MSSQLCYLVHSPALPCARSAAQQYTHIVSMTLCNTAHLQYRLRAEIVSLIPTSSLHAHFFELYVTSIEIYRTYSTYKKNIQDRGRKCDSSSPEAPEGCQRATATCYVNWLLVGESLYCCEATWQQRGATHQATLVYTLLPVC
jgi:hypothetical protein